jgi:formiminotetrahydrofolate cyclodeaminase
MSDPSFADRTVRDFLAAVAARQPAPSAGAVIALTMAAAAGLAAMAARFAPADAPGLAGSAGLADELRQRLVTLADADAVAYGEVLSAAKLARDDPTRPARRRAALHTATEVPLDMARAGAEVAALAARLAGAGNPNLVGDARAAVRLAEAGVRAAADLVRLNVERGELDDESLVAEAQACERSVSNVLSDVIGSTTNSARTR